MCPSAAVLKLIACHNSIISVPSPWLRAHFHEKLTNMSSHPKGVYVILIRYIRGISDRVTGITVKMKHLRQLINSP